MIASKLLKCLSMFPTGTRSIYTSAIAQRARKGTRMKKEAKKKASKKIEVKKVFIPYQKRLEMEKVGTLSPRRDDSGKGFPIDDVYFKNFYRWKIYTVEEALTMHRETQHPTMFNMPNADVVASIELSMAADRKNQFIDEFSNIILLPNQFEFNHNRTILAICKDEEMLNEIKPLNITLPIGTEAIKMIEKGTLDLKLYEHVVCHSSLLPDLIGIRALLKKKFPSPRNGTAGADLVPILTRLMKGIRYSVVKDKYDHDYGKVEAKIGTLEMDHKHIEENLKVLLNEIENMRPQTRSKRLITLVNVNCANSRELFKIDHNQYLPILEADEEEVEIAKAAK